MACVCSHQLQWNWPVDCKSRNETNCIVKKHAVFGCFMRAQSARQLREPMRELMRELHHAGHMALPKLACSNAWWEPWHTVPGCLKTHLSSGNRKRSARVS